jgi:N-acetylglucosaminyl-diphospho-decaprenol L-rhamnosyltransferase
LISIVVVSWNSGADLAACVESLALARGPARAVETELIVVDNHSDVDPADPVRRLWPDARVAVLSENIGFGPGVNHAAAHARGEIILLVNPDARALGDPFGALARAFEEHPDWIAVAPRLVDADSGSSASPRDGSGRSAFRGVDSQATFQLRRLPTLRQAFRELLLIDRAFPGNRGRARDRYLDRDRSVAFEVEQPAAAVLAIRTAAFSRAGGFDPRFAPAWWEDVDLCERLGAAGKIVYYPDAVFAHSGGASAKSIGYARFLPVYYRHAVLFWKKHRGARTVVFRALVAAGMVLRILLLPWRRDDPRPRRESLAAYLGALKAAWS